jgi:ribosomal protein L2
MQSITPHGGGEGKKSGKGLESLGKPNNRGKTTNSKKQIDFQKKK